MSWDKYVSEQLVATGKVKQGAICGLDGSLWAASPGFNVTPAEVKTVVGNFGKEELRMKGVVLAGEKFFYLSDTEGSIRAKKGQRGLHITKTKTAVIIGLYEDPTQPGECATTVEALADYLKDCNY